MCFSLSKCITVFFVYLRYLALLFCGWSNASVCRCLADDDNGDLSNPGGCVTPKSAWAARVREIISA